MGGDQQESSGQQAASRRPTRQMAVGWPASFTPAGALCKATLYVGRRAAGDVEAGGWLALGRPASPVAGLPLTAGRAQGGAGSPLSLLPGPSSAG